MRVSVRTFSFTVRPGQVGGTTVIDRPHPSDSTLSWDPVTHSMSRGELDPFKQHFPLPREKGGQQRSQPQNS